jgi:hypothetical protein
VPREHRTSPARVGSSMRLGRVPAGRCSLVAGRIFFVSAARAAETQARDDCRCGIASPTARPALRVCPIDTRGEHRGPLQLRCDCRANRIPCSHARMRVPARRTPSAGPAWLSRKGGRAQRGVQRRRPSVAVGGVHTHTYTHGRWLAARARFDRGSRVVEHIPPHAMPALDGHGGLASPSAHPALGWHRINPPSWPAEGLAARPARRRGDIVGRHFRPATRDESKPCQAGPGGRDLPLGLKKKIWQPLSLQRFRHCHPRHRPFASCDIRRGARPSSSTRPATRPAATARPAAQIWAPSTRITNPADTSSPRQSPRQAFPLRSSRPPGAGPR